MTSDTSAVNYLPASQSGHGALYAGGIAAILASTCHHISFLLATLGLSNTRILYIVTIADWSRPFLIIVSLIALFISYQNIWRIPFTYKSGRNNSISPSKLTDKIFFSFITMLIIIVFMLPYVAPCVE
jgi:mercuric ion transport protein